MSVVAPAGWTVSVRDLRVAFGPRRVLDDVSLDVSSGEAVALVGRNGSGKTTLLRALVGMVPATSGKVVLPPSLQARDGIGATTGDPAFVSWMTPIGFGKLLVESSGDLDRGEVRACLDRVGLDQRSQRRRLGRLSQGQRALAAIAYAMVRRPSLLVLDEPFAHLDHERADSLSSLLQVHVASGGGLLYTCHTLADLALAHRVVVLEEGRVIGAWSPSDVRVVDALR